MAALASIFLLGGCFAPYGERVEPVPLERDRALGPEAAFVVPASGGPSVLGVIERTYRNAVRQKIVLQNDGSVSGENTIEVTFYGPLQAPPDAGNLRRDTATLHDIGIEMRRKLPVTMAISPEFAQNVHGPFGFALGGSTSGGRCIYGWQRIHGQRNIFLEPSTRGEISLRLRYCGRGLSDDVLLGMMYDIAVVATLPNRNWNPFGTPPPVDPAIGARGEIIRPALSPRPVQTEAPVRAAPRPAAAAPVVDRAASAPPRTQTVLPRTVPPGRLPTPVADPTAIRPTAPLTVMPPLEMPPTISDAPAAGAAPASTATPRVPSAPAVPGAAPVRQVGPTVPAAPRATGSGSPPAVPQAGAPPTVPPPPPVPAAPRVTP